MHVFISWSGERSRALAEALRDWLPPVINEVEPFMSAEDIDRGVRWGDIVASQLEASNVGIICLTPGNLRSEWILFEAGALSKALGKTRVCPLLVDLKPTDVTGPLAQFQSTRATKEDIRKLVGTINRALGEKALADSLLEKALARWWPDLEDQIKRLPAESGTAKSQRPDREILEEVLILAREQSRNIVLDPMIFPDPRLSAQISAALGRRGLDPNDCEDQLKTYQRHYAQIRLIRDLIEATPAVRQAQFDIAGPGDIFAFSLRITLKTSRRVLTLSFDLSRPVNEQIAVARGQILAASAGKE